MSISGDLLDVSVAEVMQFIHLGRRTGTLNIRSGSKVGEIGFHRGRIISAWTPESKRLGELLLEQGVVDTAKLEEMLELQKSTHPRPSLGKLLVSNGILNAEELRSVVARQIEETIYGLVPWKEGRFDFAMDELRPIDDVGVYPGDILPDINLDTQMVVLDALRIFDERNRRKLAAKTVSEARSTADQEPEPQPSVEREEDLAELFGELDHGPAGREKAAPEPPPLRLQLCTPDDDLLERLLESAPEEFTQVTPIELVDAGITLPGELPPVLVLDLRGQEDFEPLLFLSRTRPRASIVAITEDGKAAGGVYEAGALAVVPADPMAVAACLRSVLRMRRTAETEDDEISAARIGFARLRRVVADLRSGLLSATVALNLMQVISESVERAVLFLVRGNNLIALGAFGSDSNGQPLAQTTNGLTVNLRAAGALTEAVDHGQTHSMLFEEAELPAHFAAIVGRPRTGQVVIFPVLGSERVISMVYADNGELSREIEKIEILDLAAAQVGVALENEMLRRRMARQTPR